MSIAELSMVVNSNFNKPLNEQNRELAYSGSWLITTSKSFTPNKTGYYKVIVVGRGGKSQRRGGGGTDDRIHLGASGGVSISTLHLEAGKNYAVSVSSSETSFAGIMKATAGGDYANYTTAGTASGGDFNYPGNPGKYATVYYTSDSENYPGADVGVFVPGLMEEKTLPVIKVGDSSTIASFVKSGKGILGYGAGHGEGFNNATTNDLCTTGCVLIIPLEVE